MENNAITFQAVSTLTHNLGNTLIEGVTKGDMSNYTAFKVCPRPHTLGTVNDLVRDNKVPRLDGLLKTADSGEGNDTPNTDRAQGGNVGTGRDLMRGNLVVRAMSAEECDGNGLVVVLALVVQDGDRRGRFTPGGRNGERGNLSETRKLTEASATDDSNTDGACEMRDCQRGSGVTNAVGTFQQPQGHTHRRRC